MARSADQRLTSTWDLTAPLRRNLTYSQVLGMGMGNLGVSGATTQASPYSYCHQDDCS